jgi:hypothetical protein
MAAKKKVIKENFSFLHDADMKGNLELVDIDSITPWDKNTKIHTKKELQRLADGIEQYGQWRPAVVWSKDRQIRIGNGMYLAIRDVLKRKQIWVLWHEFQSKAEADLAGLYDNKSNEWSENNYDEIRELLTCDDVVDFTGKSKERLKEFSGFLDEDLDKLFNDKYNKKEDENPLTVVKIDCRKDEKDELINVLSQWVEDSGFTDLVVH